MNKYVVHNGKRIGKAYHSAPIATIISARRSNLASRVQGYVLHRSMTYVTKNAHIKEVIVYTVKSRILLTKMMNFMAIAVECAQERGLPLADRAEAIVPSFLSKINVVGESHGASLEVVGIAAVQSVHCGDEPNQAV